jgi:nicotinamidase-related amidase
MSSTAVLALDLQTGAVTPQTQETALIALRVIEQLSLDKGMPLVVSSNHTSFVEDNYSEDERLWLTLRHYEDESLFAPLNNWIEDIPLSLIVERENTSAWSPTVKMFLRKHEIDTIVVVGLGDREILYQTAMDILGDNFKLEIIKESIAVSLDDMPEGLRSQIKIRN